MLKPQSIGDLSALRSGFAPRVLSFSLARGVSSHMQNYCWTGGPSPLRSTLMKLQADMAVRVTLAALLWQCLQSCYLAGLPVQLQVEEKPLRLH